MDYPLLDRIRVLVSEEPAIVATGFTGAPAGGATVAASAPLSARVQERRPLSKEEQSIRFKGHSGDWLRLDFDEVLRLDFGEAQVACAIGRDLGRMVFGERIWPEWTEWGHQPAAERANCEALGQANNDIGAGGTVTEFAPLLRPGMRKAIPFGTVGELGLEATWWKPSSSSPTAARQGGDTLNRMFLGRLFRYRTRERHTPLENFLSTVLAELLLDRDVLDSLGESLGILIPAGAPQVRTQVRAAGDKEGIPDLVLDLPKWRLVIECKAGAPTDLDQIRLYRRLFPRAVVALVAPRSCLARTDDDTWKGVPCASWEQLATKLVMKPPTDPWARRLATEFVAMLRHHSYGPLLPVSVEAVETYAKAVRKIGKLRDQKVRETVEMLLPQAHHASVSSDELWGSAPPLESWWERERGDASLPLRGLGLRGLVEPDGALSWNLWMSTASKGPAATRLREEGFTEHRDGWWLHLHEGENDSKLEDGLSEVLMLGRASLRRLGLPAGKAAPTWRRVTPVSQLTSTWRGVRETSDRLSEWRDELAKKVTSQLQVALPAAGVWQGRIYTTLAAPSRRAWVWTDHDEPTRLQVRWGWGTSARNAARYELTRAWWKGAVADSPVELAKDKDGSVTVLSADLRRFPIEHAVESLAKVTARAFTEVPSLLA